MAKDIRKNRREALRKRKNTLFKKAYELGQLPDVEVAVIIRANGRYYTYRSTEQASWPPDMEQIQNSYPLPRNLLAQDVEARVQGRVGNVAPEPGS